MSTDRPSNGDPSARATHALLIARRALTGSSLFERLRTADDPKVKFESLSPTALRAAATTARRAAEAAERRATEAWVETGEGKQAPARRDVTRALAQARAERLQADAIPERVARAYRVVKPGPVFRALGAPGRWIWLSGALAQIDGLRAQAYVPAPDSHRSPLDRRRRAPVAVNDAIDDAFDVVVKDIRDLARQGGLTKSAYALRGDLEAKAEHASTSAASSDRGTFARKEAALRTVLGLFDARENALARAGELDSTAANVEAAFGSFYRTAEGRSVRAAFDPEGNRPDHEVTDEIVALATGFDRRHAERTHSGAEPQNPGRALDQLG